VCASVPPGRPIGPRGDRAPTGNAVRTATEARRRAAGGGQAAERPPALAGSAIAPYVSPDTRPSPIEFPILKYQQYEQAAGNHLLRDPLDPKLSELEAPRGRFKAARSMRDVEPQVLLLKRGLKNG